MQYFDFSDLIEKYSNDFTVITRSTGEWNNSGDWVDGEAVLTPMRGAIIALKESVIMRSEGSLTEKDKTLFMLEPIDDKLHGAIVVFNGNAFKLPDSIENAEFTGVYQYTLKYVSAFKDIAAKYGLTEDLRRDGETDD